MKDTLLNLMRAILVALVPLETRLILRDGSSEFSPSSLAKFSIGDVRHDAA